MDAYQRAIERLRDAVDKRERMIADRKALIEKETAALAHDERVISERRARIERERAALSIDEHDLQTEKGLLRLACGEDPSALSSLPKSDALRQELETSRKMRPRALAVLAHRGEAPTTTAEIVSIDHSHVQHRAPLRPDSLSSQLSKMANEGVIVGDGAGNWWITDKAPAGVKAAHKGRVVASGARSGDPLRADGNETLRSQKHKNPVSPRAHLHSPQRKLADKIGGELVSDGKGGFRERTDLELQHEIQTRLKVSRRKAQSAVKRSRERSRSARPDSV